MAEAAGEQKSGMMMVIIMAVVAVVLMIGGTIGGYFIGMSQNRAEVPPVAAQAPAGAAGAPAAMTIGPLLAFDDIIVNLLDENETRYLKAAITLELDSGPVADEINERKPQVRDAILLLMSSKTLAELRDLQGKLQLRADLLERINGFLQKGKVTNIYFTDFVVQ